MRFSALFAKPANDSNDVEEGRGSFAMAQGGFINLAIPLTILGTLIVAIIGLKFLGSSAPDLITSIGNVTAAVTTTDLGDSTANSMRGIFATLIAVGGLVGIAVLALSVLKFRGQ